MADIKKELNDIKNAVYGKEVRSSIHDGIEKINEESEESRQKAEEAHEITQDLLDETFDSAALEANFEQRLNDEIANLQPEWTHFKNDTVSQLAQIAINIKSYDVEEIDGVIDISSVFETASNVARLINSPLNLPKGNYYLKLNKDMIAPKILGNGSTLTIEGDFSLEYSDMFFLSDLTIISNNVRSSVNPTPTKPVFNNDGTAEYVGLYNVFFKANTLDDGVNRGSAAFRGKEINHLFMENVFIQGFRAGISISKGESKDINGKNMLFNNVEVPIYIGGASPTTNEDIFVDGIYLEKIIHVNTEEQEQHFYRFQGSDTIMLEKCRNIIIRDVHSERAIERAVYANIVEDIVLDGFTIKDTSGIKICGDVRFDENKEYYSMNIKIRNIEHDTNRNDDKLFTFYFTKDIEIENVEMEGNDIASQFMAVSWYVSGLKGRNIKVNGVKRFFMQYVNFDRFSAEEGIPPNPLGNFNSVFEDVEFKHVRGERIGLQGYNYYAFEFLDESEEDGFRVKNIKLNDVLIKNQESAYGNLLEEGDIALRGLIDVSKVDGLYIDDSFVQGHRLYPTINPNLFPIRVGAESKKVYINYQQRVRLPQGMYKRDFNLSNLFVSEGTTLQYELMTPNKNMIDKGVVTIDPSVTESDIRRLATKWIVTGQLRALSSGNEEFYLWGNHIDPPNKYIGVVKVVVSEGQYGLFTIDRDFNSILADGDGEVFSTSSASGYLAVLTNEDMIITLRDRRDRTSVVLVDYNLSNSPMQ